MGGRDQHPLMKAWLRGRGRLSYFLPKLGSGLIDQSQKQKVAAIVMADMKVWAQRS